MKKVLVVIKDFIVGIFSDKKKAIIALIVIVILGIIVMATYQSAKEQKMKQQAIADAIEKAKKDQQSAQANADNPGDSLLIQQQPDLVKSYGKVPKGYIWNTDGTLLSLGDKKKSAEDVVYAYLNGIRTLDFSIAQKYSRGSSVVKSYQDYFNSDTQDTDYFDSFMRSMYKEALLSLKVESILDNSIFAENKQVFTVKVSMLDLTTKDFWEKDKYDIYKNLYVYSSDESDATKGEMYLYDYVLGYYQGKNAKMRTFNINLTLQKYPDLNTGWLVSIDTDINSACNYSDGTLMVNYINKMYSSEGIQYIQQQRGTGTGPVEDNAP